MLLFLLMPLLVVVVVGFVATSTGFCRVLCNESYSCLCQIHRHHAPHAPSAFSVYCLCLDSWSSFFNPLLRLASLLPPNLLPQHAQHRSTLLRPFFCTNLDT